MFTKFKSSLKLIKASWNVVKSDKKIISVYLLQFVMGLLILGGVSVLLIGTGLVGLNTIEGVNSTEMSTYISPVAVVIGILAYLALTIIGEFTTAYVVVTALGRFRGTPCNHRQVMAKLAAHKVGILKFGLLSASIGALLSALENRLPLAGRIAVWLVNASWQIATMFAIPVIVDRGEERPLIAAKESVLVLKKTFGDNLRVNLGLGVVFAAVFIASILTIIPVTMLASLVGVGTSAFVGITVGMYLISMVIAILVANALGAVIKAGLYEYATSGKTYGEFDQEMFKQVITEKKARKVFGF